ncbi:T6SS phospholipase effector Tle1-like catalytic domain-containing protein [Pseudomonas sp. NPDC090202]|uniref:T6SS phospholipase effector Tle1-like catalytic domain-containing protein n=1 Tax=unclassified Pseudomonas TaxID=196821 RepID=UPI0037FF6CCC
MTALHRSTRSSGSAAGALGVTVRIGIFFDGTGNNRVNSQIGADCQAMAEIYNHAHIKECGGRHSDPNSSYSNDFTNIARLVTLYRQQPKAINRGEGFKVYAAVYVSGAGTTSGRRDSVSGLGWGRGATGVLAKVSRAVKKIAEVLAGFEQDNPGCVIAALELDIFGFSRGAASARHLANEVLKQCRGAMDAVLDQRKLPLAADFSWGNGSVRLKVIGLFDTVAAIGGIADLGNVRDSVNSRVNLYLSPGCAQQVLHLVAADEHRRNFALNSVTPSWPKEIVLPGSHSDIGGGYHPQAREKVALTRPRRSLVSVGTPFDETEVWLQTHADLADVDGQHWLDADDASASIAVECVERMGQRSHGVKTVVASVVLERQVFGHLSRVYLRVMHALALDEGVPFEPVPDTPELSLPAELQDIALKLVAFARGRGEPLSDAEMQMLYRRYIHCSSHWNRTLFRRGTLAEVLFVHAPARNGREMFFNMGQTQGAPPLSL